MTSIGRPDGPEEQVFGLVTDVALSPNGTLYVADPQFRRVGVFDAEGKLRRWIGRTGSGPGEFIAPIEVEALDSLLAVYDDRLGRVSIFDTAGAFRRSFSASGRFVRSIERGPDALLLTNSMDSLRLHLVGLDGKLLRRMVRRPPVEAEIRGNYLPEAGAVCTRPDRKVLYLNPWMYEMGLLDPGVARYEWVRRWPSETLRPSANAEEGAGRAVQGGMVLGMACTRRFVATAYLRMSTGELTYDIFDPDAKPLGRLKFQRNSGGGFPGFIADGIDDRIVTFRTRPFSEVFVFRIVRAE